MESQNDNKFETLLPIFSNNSQIEYDLLNKLNHNLFREPVTSPRFKKFKNTYDKRHRHLHIPKPSSCTEFTSSNSYPATPISKNKSNKLKVSSNSSIISDDGSRLITPISSPPIEKRRTIHSNTERSNSKAVLPNEVNYSLPIFTVSPDFKNNGDNKEIYNKKHATNQYIHSRSNSFNNSFLTPPPSIASSSDNEDGTTAVSSDIDDSMDTTQEVMTIASKIPLFRRRKNNYINKPNIMNQNGPVILKLCKVNFNSNKKNQINQLDHISNKTISTKQRKFLCKICSMAFTTSGHLTRHNKIHTGEKNFVCPQKNCGQRFSRHDNCLQHYRTHLKKLNK